VFNVEAAENACKSRGSYLTYSQLANYYNEFVIQLRLAEHNLNVSLALEVKKDDLTKGLERETKIIEILNESILPALEFTVSSYFTFNYCNTFTVHITTCS